METNKDVPFEQWSEVAQDRLARDVFTAGDARRSETAATDDGLTWDVKPITPEQQEMESSWSAYQFGKSVERIKSQNAIEHACMFWFLVGFALGVVVMGIMTVHHFGFSIFN